ncbi:hypothetical protein HN587_01475 [Candidatus Woesearchaeota archaeon]|nr:hypothetical protein [Candidatus Woesearchaeota archaeon]
MAKGLGALGAILAAPVIGASKALAQEVQLKPYTPRTVVWGHKEPVNAYTSLADVVKLHEEATCHADDPAFGGIHNVAPHVHMTVDANQGHYQFAVYKDGHLEAVLLDHEGSFADFGEGLIPFGGDGQIEKVMLKSRDLTVDSCGTYHQEIRSGDELVKSDANQRLARGLFKTYQTYVNQVTMPRAEDIFRYKK